MRNGSTSVKRVSARSAFSHSSANAPSVATRRVELSQNQVAQRDDERTADGGQHAKHGHRCGSDQGVGPDAGEASHSRVEKIDERRMDVDVERPREIVAGESLVVLLVEDDGVRPEQPPEMAQRRESGEGQEFRSEQSLHLRIKSLGESDRRVD
jgi:hypothetical protein